MTTPVGSTSPRPGTRRAATSGSTSSSSPHVDAVPEIVAAFLASMADQITGRAGDPWRPTVGLHLRILGAWLDDVFGLDPAGAARELAAVGELPGVSVRGHH